MKMKLMMIICCLSFSLMASAQASGGQIRRVTPKRSGNASNRTVSSANAYPKTKTYTVKEQYEIGSSYYDKGNYQEAIKWYTKAAENGHRDAQSELGFMYLNGEGVPINKPVALKWLIKAGENGDAMAQQILGYMYRNGDGVYKSESESQKWFRKAAPTFYDLSRNMMKSGNQQSVNFFKDVIDMKVIPYNVLSMFHIGAMYYYGEGGLSVDYNKAFEYFSQAAKERNGPALYYVGLCYDNGYGVPQDKILAREYYKKSGFTSLPSRDF